MVDLVMNKEDYIDPNLRDDVIVQASQVRLFQKVNMTKTENLDYEGNNPIISDDIKDLDFRKDFNREMTEKEIVRINNIKHLNFDEDHEQAVILRMAEGDIYTRFKLKEYIETSVSDWKIYTFKRRINNHLASLTNFIQLLVTNQGENDIDTESLMHILQRRFDKISYSIDAIGISYITNFFKLFQTPTVSNTFNSFKFKL
jgi:hypothetical protein